MAARVQLLSTVLSSFVRQVLMSSPVRFRLMQAATMSQMTAPIVLDTESCSLALPTEAYLILWFLGRNLSSVNALKFLPPAIRLSMLAQVQTITHFHLMVAYQSQQTKLLKSIMDGSIRPTQTSLVTLLLAHSLQSMAQADR